MAKSMSESTSQTWLEILDEQALESANRFVTVATEWLTNVRPKYEDYCFDVTDPVEQ